MVVNVNIVKRTLVIYVNVVKYIFVIKVNVVKRTVVIYVKVVKHIFVINVKTFTCDKR